VGLMFGRWAVGFRTKKFSKHDGFRESLGVVGKKKKKKGEQGEQKK